MPDNSIQRITELYAGVFEVALPDGAVAENILFGNRYGILQATVEIHEGAVPHLVRLCDEIKTYEGLPWRLLKFDQGGVHELDPDDFRELEDYCIHASLGNT